MNGLISIGEEAKDILISLHLSPVEGNEYNAVKRKLDALFVASRKSKV